VEKEPGGGGVQWGDHGGLRQLVKRGTSGPYPSFRVMRLESHSGEHSSTRSRSALLDATLKLNFVTRE
jgi:hypothetical protein